MGPTPRHISTKRGAALRPTAAQAPGSAQATMRDVARDRTSSLTIAFREPEAIQHHEVLKLKLADALTSGNAW